MPLPPLPPAGLSRAYDYTVFQAANPNSPLPADRIETDYDALFGWTNTARAWMDAINPTALGLTADAATSAAQAAASQAAAATSATNAATSATNAAASAASAATAVAGRILRAGDTMTGALGLIAPTADNHAARRRDLPLEYLRTSAAIVGNPSTVEFVLDATYVAFEFDLFDLAPTSNTSLAYQLSTDGGATWISGASDYAWARDGTAGAASGNSGAAFAFYAQDSGVAVGVNARLALEMSARHVGRAAGVGFVTAVASYIGVAAFGADRARANRIRFFFNGSTFANRGVIIQRGIRA